MIELELEENEDAEDKDDRRSGEDRARRAEASKLSRKMRRCVQQLQKHDPDVKISATPTQCLFVANSGVLCGVTFEELEGVFREFDADCELTVFASLRPYSFVRMATAEAAERARDQLHGRVPPALHRSALPFYIAFVENLPSVKRPKGSRAPRDLRILENFVSEDEERLLMASLEMCADRRTKLKSRRVVHFGYQFNYDTNDAFARTENPIPDCCGAIIERMRHAGVFREPPDQITVNVYEPGNGIPSHVDTHSAFGDTIASLSLMSDLVMEWRDFANTSDVYDVLLPRFSLAVMQGESRYRWKHGIAKRKYDVNPENNRLLRRQLRVSFTFRNIAKTKCECAYIEYCDWDRDGAMKIPDEDAHGRAIERDYVTTVYDSIADHFDTTRHSQWVAVSKFLDGLPSGAVLFDVGCGNGKYFERNDGLLKFGCDMCEELCAIASRKDCGGVCRADVLVLPFRDASADAVLSIAVVHHISTVSRRLRAVREILRVLRAGGRACITVWSLDQTIGDAPSEYLKMRAKKKNVQMNRRESHGRLRVHEGREFTQQDVLVPWQNADGERFLRYYHVFVEGELEQLLMMAGGCVLDSVVYEQGNWIAIVTKE